MSTARIRWSAIASAVAKLMAVVVLPTPPFWLAMDRTRDIGCLTYRRLCFTWNIGAASGYFKFHVEHRRVGELESDSQKAPGDRPDEGSSWKPNTGLSQ